MRLVHRNCFLIVGPAGARIGKLRRGIACSLCRGARSSWSLRSEIGFEDSLRRSGLVLSSTSIDWRNFGVLLDEPYTRQLDGKLRELRFHLEGQRVRVTYWIAPGRRIIL